MPKILAIDYGTKHIGLAISDPAGAVALPYQTMNIKSKLVDEHEKIIADLVNLAKVEAIEGIIIGMPLKADGQRTKLGDEIFIFSKNLNEQVTIPVDVIDERFTSKLAARLPHQTARNVHELSAQIMLQEYLDSNQ